MSSLKGEIALVTGTTRGIGKAVVLELARRGASVVGTAVNQEEAEELTAMFSAAGLDGRGEVLDVAIQTSVDSCIRAVRESVGAPTILVNNAGITRDNLLIRMKDEEWQAIMETNLSSVFRMSRACLRGMMKARRGRIISISSIVGSSGNPGQSNYAAAKAGLEGFSRALAREVGSRGITVNCIAPGFIDTHMTRALSDEQRTALAARIPLERLGSVDDIAHAVAFLASPSGGYISGQTLHVNGGMYMN